ncbi:DUF6232 family protein [Shewanella sp.]|uniref:DUF6232 family protein n=1 Tax=Shewanella sp. TaxID=50422 RepID=UPI003D0B555A
MDEKVFFNQGDVTVTNARFIVSGQTYAMNGVTSVKQLVNAPNRGGPIVFGLIGGSLLLSKIWLPAILLIGIAVIWWRKQSPDWIVALNSSSGETKALTSKDGTFIRNVINALNESIIHRG